MKKLRLRIAMLIGAIPVLVFVIRRGYIPLYWSQLDNPNLDKNAWNLEWAEKFYNAHPKFGKFLSKIEG